MQEIIDKMQQYASEKGKTLFSREEVLEAIGRNGMHILIKWDVLEDQGNGQYQLSGYEV
jgi:hypothetical protein